MKTKPKILVIAEDFVSRLIFSQWLEKYGLGVSFEIDRESGLAQLAHDNSIDAVLADYTTLRLGGFRSPEQMKEMALEIPLVVITESGAVQTVQMGATACLAKPVNLNELIVLLQRVLRERILGAETAL